MLLAGGALFLLVLPSPSDGQPCFNVGSRKARPRRVVIGSSASEGQVWGLGKDSRSRARLVLRSRECCTFPGACVGAAPNSKKRCDLRLSFCACASPPLQCNVDSEKLFVF